jgi:hypothetical protein
MLEIATETQETVNVSPDLLALHVNEVRFEMSYILLNISASKRTHVCMYVCMYVCIYVYVYILIYMYEYSAILKASVPMAVREEVPAGQSGIFPFLTGRTTTPLSIPVATGLVWPTVTGMKAQLPSVIATPDTSHPTVH